VFPPDTANERIFSPNEKKHYTLYNNLPAIMAPKKKNNKQDDDWEAELGEAAPGAAPENDGAAAEADPEDEFPQGGLMAMMRKKQKKNKKGKQGGEDFVEGEDPAAADGQQGMEDKAPVEASIDDEFAMPEKKGKGKAGAAAKKDEDDDEEKGADGKVLTKAQKEKLKKEREKQRKKENVSIFWLFFANLL
jgi:translation initiation factor 5B